MYHSAWPFLISRNKTVDYKSVTIPEFFTDPLAEARLLRWVKLEPPTELREANIDDEEYGFLQLVYRVIPAQNDKGTYQDCVGRDIYWIEGVILRDEYTHLKDPTDALCIAHKRVVGNYNTFWDGNTKPSFSSEMQIEVVKHSHDNLEQEKIPYYKLILHRIRKRITKRNILASIVVLFITVGIVLLAVRPDPPEIKIRMENTKPLVRNKTDRKLNLKYIEVILTAEARDSKDGQLKGQAIKWESDRNTKLLSKKGTSVHALLYGIPVDCREVAHKITAIAINSQGLRARHTKVLRSHCDLKRKKISKHNNVLHRKKQSESKNRSGKKYDLNSKDSTDTIKRNPKQSK